MMRQLQFWCQHMRLLQMAQRLCTNRDSVTDRRLASEAAEGCSCSRQAAHLTLEGAWGGHLAGLPQEMQDLLQQAIEQATWLQPLHSLVWPLQCIRAKVLLLLLLLLRQRQNCCLL